MDIYKADSLISSFYEFDIVPRESNYKSSFKISKNTFMNRIHTIKKNRKQLMKIHTKKKNIKQLSDEWFDIRRNMLTASQTMEYIRKTPSVIKQKQNKESNSFTSSATSWGNMFEPVAKQLYCNMNKIHLLDIGFMVHNKLDFYGASPDGVTPNGTLVEFKCPISRPIIKDKIPDKYMAQIQGQMAVCELSECDYCEFEFETITEEEFIELENINCGIIVHNDESHNIYTHCCNEPYRSYLKTLSYKNKTFWKLKNYQIIRVNFDNDKWNTFYQKKIKEFWELVNKK